MKWKSFGGEGAQRCLNMSKQELYRMNEPFANWRAATMRPPIGCGHARMVVESWVGKTPDQIAAELHCHPQTVRFTWRVSTSKA
jgi:hypothetical protein